MTQVPAVYPKARRHLVRRDPVLKRLIGAIGPCTLGQNANHFAALVRSIISQQISTKAAAAISARLEQALAPTALSPEGILALSSEDLRAAGLSGNKTRSLCELAERVHNQTLPLGLLHELPIFAKGFDVFTRNRGPLSGDYPGYHHGDFPVTETMHDRLVFLPVLSNPSPEAAGFVLDAIRKATNRVRRPAMV